MEQLSLAFKKTFSFILVFFVSFVMVFGVFVEGVMAQGDPNDDSGVQDQPAVQVQNGTVTAPAAQGSQGATVSGGNNPDFEMTLSEQGAVNGIAGCAASVVSSALSNSVGQLIGKYAGSDNLFNVHITSSNTVAEGGDSNGTFPGLNAIGYCVINAVLEYLTQATIDWINSGFDGNPAFVDNPEQFFKDIADIETAHFLQDLVQGSTGIDICEPFRMQIVTGLAGSAGGSFADQSRCTLEDIGASLGESGVDFDYEDYTSGNSQYNGNLNAWWEVTQNDQNNPYGLHYMTQKELSKRLQRKGNAAQLDLTMGSGFLSFKTCSKDETYQAKDGTTRTAKGTCAIDTPGTLIENQVNRALGAGRDRLILADKFDQIITALVNQLIKTALNEVLADDEE